MNQKTTHNLQKRLLEAIYMTESGTPLKDWLEHSEIFYLLKLYSLELIKQGIVQPYDPEPRLRG